MKYHRWLFAILSLALVSGCSGEQSQAKRLILEAFPKSAAVKFGDYTQFDDKNGCYQIHVKNYRGQEQELFISLNKADAAGSEWGDWKTTQNIDECHDAFN